MGLPKKKVKVGNLFLLIACGILIVMGVFIGFYITGNAPYISFPLPLINPAIPQYRHAIFGENENVLNKPMGVATANNQIYVTDTNNAKVRVFLPSGEPVMTFGEVGRNPGQFRFPYGIAVDTGGRIFVGDTYNSNISVFDPSGQFLYYFVQDNDLLTQPSGMLIRDDHLFVCNLNPGYLLVFSLESGELVRIIGESGSGDGELRLPNDLAFGPDGNIYISDTGNNRIQVFAQDGTFVRTMPIEEGELYSPRGLTFSPFGELYVVNILHGEVAVFDRDGKRAGRFGENLLNLPNGLVIDQRSRRIYVTDHVSVLVFE